MRSRKHQDEGPKVSDVGSIVATKEGPDSEQKDFDEVIIHHDYLD